MTSAAEKWTSRRQALWGSFNGLACVPRLPPTRYALLLHLMTQQETGDLIVATHEELAAGLAMERGMITRAHSTWSPLASLQSCAAAASNSTRPSPRSTPRETSSGPSRRYPTASA